MRKFSAILLAFLLAPWAMNDREVIATDELEFVRAAEQVATVAALARPLPESSGR